MEAFTPVVSSLSGAAGWGFRVGPRPLRSSPVLQGCPRQEGQSTLVAPLFTGAAVKTTEAGEARPSHGPVQNAKEGDL